MTKISTKLVGSSMSDRIVYHSVRAIVTAFCRIWCRMTVSGGDHIPPTGVFILAPTHRSIIDTPVSRSEARAYRAAIAARPEMTSTLLPIGSGIELSVRWPGHNTKL